VLLVILIDYDIKCGVVIGGRVDKEYKTNRRDVRELGLAVKLSTMGSLYTSGAMMILWC